VRNELTSTRFAVRRAAQLPVALLPWEQAEAEAEADLLDADVEACGRVTMRVAAAARHVVPCPVEITEFDLAEAECEADLCHVDDAA
jgi:hypothetical protein